MADERKYREEEVKEIFDLAARRDEIGRPDVSDEGGLTLAELQEVGREVGIEPREIAEAAFALDARGEGLPRRTVLGVPISVGRVVELPRAVTDREWDVLVGDLRETFGAKGKISSQGGVREWTNGNLHAFLEPTATGHRLRLGTQKGSAVPAFIFGAVGLAVGLALFTLFFFEDLGRASLVIPTLMAILGSVILASNVISLPRWAREREGQMEHIASCVGLLIGGSSQDE